MSPRCPTCRSLQVFEFRGAQWVPGRRFRDCVEAIKYAVGVPGHELGFRAGALVTYRIGSGTEVVIADPNREWDKSPPRGNR